MRTNGSVFCGMVYTGTPFLRLVLSSRAALSAFRWLPRWDCGAQLASVEARRALDMEGFTADVTYLRRSLAAVDRRVQQLKLVHRLDDDERLDALLDELERRAPDVEGPPDDGRSDAGSVTSALGGDLRGIRAALGGLQARLDTSRRKLPGRPAPPAPAASKAPGKAKRAAPKSAPPGGRKPAR